MALFEALAWAGWWWVCARWPVVPSERMYRRVASASGRPGLPQRGAQRGPNSSSQHAAEIIYVAMVELETEAALPFCAKTGAQTDRERGLIRQSNPQLVAPATANSLD